ncbi:MAG TPA: acetyl-CoA carboxylase biotin carboxyl carrier protein subunit [Edaphobacter sp.]|nr:acetyl-CoA carboxylase biotin carboxyl carrier protein subunit [Edaphobacter sp.]
MGFGRAAGGFAVVMIRLEIEGRKHTVELPVGAVSGAVECIVDGQRTAVDMRVLEAGVMSLVVGGRQFRCFLDGDGVVIEGRRYGFEVDDPRSLRGRKGGGAGVDGPRPVKAPMPGRVVRVMVNDGQDVTEGEAIVVIEAMKMQNELRSPKAGRVVRVAVGVGDAVGAGDVLAVVE